MEIDETKEIYENLKGSNGNNFSATLDIMNDQINIFIPGGGCICLRPNGTWLGDVAPFCD